MSSHSVLTQSLSLQPLVLEEGLDTPVACQVVSRHFEGVGASAQGLLAGCGEAQSFDAEVRLKHGYEGKAAPDLLAGAHGVCAVLQPDHPHSLRAPCMTPGDALGLCDMDAYHS